MQVRESETYQTQRQKKERQKHMIIS